MHLPSPLFRHYQKDLCNNEGFKKSIQVGHVIQYEKLQEDGKPYSEAIVRHHFGDAGYFDVNCAKYREFLDEKKETFDARRGDFDNFKLGDFLVSYASSPDGDLKLEFVHCSDAGTRFGYVDEDVFLYLCYRSSFTNVCLTCEETNPYFTFMIDIVIKCLINEYSDVIESFFYSPFMVWQVCRSSFETAFIEERGVELGSKIFKDCKKVITTVIEFDEMRLRHLAFREIVRLRLVEFKQKAQEKESIQDK